MIINDYIAFQNSVFYSNVNLYDMLPQEIKEIENYLRFKRNLGSFILEELHY